MEGFCIFGVLPFVALCRPFLGKPPFPAPILTSPALGPHGPGGPMAPGTWGPTGLGGPWPWGPGAPVPWALGPLFFPSRVYFLWALAMALDTMEGVRVDAAPRWVLLLLFLSMVQKP